ncbi:hypothetical protein Tco_1451779, partial [Tanacetum coccineum]
MQKNNSTIYCQQNSSSPNIHNQITTSKSIQDTAFGNSADVNNRVAYKDNYFLQKPACTGTDRRSNSCNSQVNNTGSTFFSFRSDKVVTYTKNFPSLEMEDGGRCGPSGVVSRFMDRSNGSYQKVAANRIGCAVLNTPFRYLGVTVGECMSQKSAWVGLVNKLQARLSKWKVKTLSIGG